MFKIKSDDSALEELDDSPPGTRTPDSTDSASGSGTGASIVCGPLSRGDNPVYTRGDNLDPQDELPSADGMTQGAKEEPDEDLQMPKLLRVPTLFRREGSPLNVPRGGRAGSPPI